ncbi:MAG: energy transducer TonB [Flavobacteriales bacterium]|nr:energy transducer TonB [Flavobacteriales bacterium]
MRLFLLSILLFLFTTNWSQNDTVKVISPNDPNAIYDVVEVPPEFPGGMAKMYEYLGSSIIYPKKAAKKNITGKVYVQFVVTQTGEITEVEILKGAHPLLDEESIRVISAMPNWKPGEQRGKKVRVRYTIPINYTL